jgi:hypothetical protein
MPKPEPADFEEIILTQEQVEPYLRVKRDGH